MKASDSFASVFFRTGLTVKIDGTGFKRFVVETILIGLAGRGAIANESSACPIYRLACRQMGRAGYERFITKFTADKMVEDTVKIYEDALAGAEN